MNEIILNNSTGLFTYLIFLYTPSFYDENEKGLEVKFIRKKYVNPTRNLTKIVLYLFIVKEYFYFRLGKSSNEMSSSQLKIM
jgi:hypothetical protein